MADRAKLDTGKASLVLLIHRYLGGLMDPFVTTAFSVQSCLTVAIGIGSPCGHFSYVKQIVAGPHGVRKIFGRHQNRPNTTLTH